ncbi:hypothetical protein KVV02_007356 [Mortierella alpina]|uniref:Uncharacterized protein n=1 Tax=Mortierella alpina TaxID=64518 RepID=A0A9P8AAA7_MORAP|nr:hypothetical protein KVV02_007356 [Mortierella alpina]
MAVRLQAPQLIIDKRQTDAGTEYLVSATNEWIASSTSRVIHPELVELYEWLHNSGFRSDATVFAPSTTHVATAKGARKRIQSSSGPLPAYRRQSDTQVEGSVAAKSDSVRTGDGQAKLDDEAVDEAAVGILDPSIASQDPPMPKLKKQRLEGSYIEEMSHLVIETPEESALSTKSSPIPASAIHDMSLEDKEHTASGSESNLEMDEPQVMAFNKNTEQMIEVYFKEGMDASGVEMFDILLGPYRRPNKEFVAAFFYAVILSPLTEPVTIEAAVHVLDRILTLHGPEPFELLWDVQKRRREVSDGTNPFTRQSGSTMAADSSSGTGSGMGAAGMSSRLNGTGRHNADFTDISLQNPFSSLSGRLPSWNSIWDLIKAQLGLDTRPESKQHIALQEYHIRMRLEGDEQLHSPPSTRGKSKPGTNAGSEDEFEGEEIIKEEQEIREGIGRLIVGVLLRVLEQDAVLKNLSKTSFFCRYVLQLQPYTSAQSIQQALNVAFQIVGLASSARYLEQSPQPPSGTSTSITGTGRGASATAGPTSAAAPRPAASWPLNERFKLNAEGAEIMQLGQQVLLLMIRFTEAGQLFPGKGMEELVREVEGRLTKINRDQRRKPSVPFLQERRSLDQTEIFLKLLIQGPSLLDRGTGSGAGVKLRKENSEHTDEHLDTFGSAFGEDCAGVLKSQTGTSMGSSVFVMNMVDYWFRTRTTSSQTGGFNGLLSFHRVLVDYARPIDLRLASSLTDSAPAAPVRKAKAAKAQPKRSTRSRKSPDLEADEDDEEDIAIDLTSVKISTPSTSSLDEAEPWNAKDLRELEWVVMMLEVLVWSWIEARGIRKEDIKGTGLDLVLFPDDIASQQSQSSSQGGTDTGSGWQEMSSVLSKIGGTLQTRWELLEAAIEAAIMMEELGLR